MAKNTKAIHKNAKKYLKNLDAIDEQAKFLIENGHKVLQWYRFADNDYAHVERLLRWAEFKSKARVIDMGSGTGEVSRIMSEIRKDLSFCLVNISEYQLGLSKARVKHCCDFCHVPEPDQFFDAAMFCFSIGFADTKKALQEASRLLKKGGILFIVDMAKEAGKGLTLPLVEYSIYHTSEMESAAEKVGFVKDFYMEPGDNGEYGRSVFGNSLDAIIKGVIPAIWRFVKK